MKAREISKMEKGEYSHLLSDDLVKPLPEEAKRKPFSWTRCLVRFLVISLIVLFVLVTATATGAYFWMRHQVRRFTVDGMDGMPDPPLPINPMPAAQLDVVKDKAKLFWDQLRAGERVEEFAVTQDELNALIASSDFLRGHAYVTLDEDKWYTDLVLPADNFPGGKGRYFIGHGLMTTDKDESAQSTKITTELTPKHPVPGMDHANILLGKFLAYRSKDDDTSVLEMEYGQFINWVAPQDWIDRRENLLRCDSWDDSSDDSSDDEDHSDEDCQEFMDTLGRLASIELREGKIVFTPRGNDGENGVRRGRRLSEEGKPSFPLSWQTFLVRRVLNAAI